MSQKVVKEWLGGGAIVQQPDPRFMLLVAAEFRSMNISAELGWVPNSGGVLSITVSVQQLSDGKSAELNAFLAGLRICERMYQLNGQMFMYRVW